MGPRKFALSRKKHYSRAPKPSQHWSTLQTTLKGIDLGQWTYITTPPANTIRLCKFNSTVTPTATSTTATLTFDICFPTMKWSLRVHDKPVLLEQYIQDLPLTIKSASDVTTIFSLLQAFHVCTGINDPKFSPITRLRRNFYTKKGMNIY